MSYLDLKTDFSATGDGTTDDSAAVFAAIDYCGCNGLDLHVPKGTYLISQSYSLKSGFRIIGAGAGSIFKLADGSTITAATGLFSILPGSGTSIENISIDGNKANNASLSIDGLVIPAGVSDINLSNVRIYSIPGSASNGNGINISTALADIDLSAVRSYSNDLNGILTSDGDDIVLTGCECTSNGGNGLSLVGNNRVTVIGGRYHSNTLDNIAVGLNTSGINLSGVVASISGDVAADSLSAVNDSSVGTIPASGITLISADDPGSKFSFGATSSSAGWINVKDYGAIGDGTTDDTAAFNAAVTAAGVSVGGKVGGVVFVPKGDYKLTSTLDLTSVISIWLMGEGPRTSTITTTVSGANPGVIIGDSANRLSRISDIGILQSGAVTPAAKDAGNYGIRTESTGTGYGIAIDNVEVRFFGDSAIMVQGSTGPTVIRDCSLQNCAAYGLEVLTNVTNPQDVRIEGGNIQACYGGIHLNIGSSFSAYDVDIELSTAAVFPAFYSENASGVSCVGVTASISGALAPIVPAAVVALDATKSFTWIGGLNFVTNPNTATDNISIAGAATRGVTFIGGVYTNVTGALAGYFCSVSSALRSTFINPNLTAATYDTGYDIVNDTATQDCICIGVKSAARSTLAEVVSSEEIVGNTVTGVNGYKERSRSTLMGEWTTPAYNAGDFVGVGGGTWTVADGDRTTHSYALVGKTCFYNVKIDTSTISGTVTLLTVALPFTSAKAVWTAAVSSQAAAETACMVATTASGTTASFRKIDRTAFTPGTDNFSIQFSIVYEIT